VVELEEQPVELKILRGNAEVPQLDPPQQSPRRQSDQAEVEAGADQHLEAQEQGLVSLGHPRKRSWELEQEGVVVDAEAAG